MSLITEVEIPKHQFKDLIKELKAIHKDIMFSFQEYNDNVELFDYVTFTFGFCDINDYIINVDFKNNRVGLESDVCFNNSDNKIYYEDIKDVCTVMALLETHIDLIRDTFR